MHKKGQFFFIAALMAVIILLSVVTTFTRARAPQTQQTVAILAKEMKAEAIAQMNSDASTGKTAEETWMRLEGLTQNYSLLNPQHEIFIFYGNESQLKVRTYNAGLGSIITGGIYSNATTLEFTRDSSKYVYLRSLGKEYYVLIIKRGENGKNIAAE